MDKLIKVNRNSIFLVLSIILISCSASRLSKNDKELMNINFSSIYNDENLTLSINGSSYYVNQPIKTDRSLGIDMKSYLSIKDNKIYLKGVFTAKTAPDLDENYTRELKIDTILNRSNGSNILIKARKDTYTVKQQNRVFKVE
ncbi:hypothetical protein OOZ15_19515 [Galbibacter sp. EGI 63066]|uniref:hypothetical protein n=1 Tax=Galbibacter sp. EGI 63066 TaxID=2993559 RepID=UPI0022490E04|nr:hypothetical protein [Galbibacter sp. EGI 63066]MCX2682144.1 hypothetical protein [Galbibacter sp. EGI 63066]